MKLKTFLCKTFVTFVFMTLVPLSAYSHINLRNSDEQKVKKIVSDFNNLLFSEMNASQALQKHYYLNRVDNIDSKFGLESDYLDITKGIKNRNKLKYYVTGFYFLNNLEFVQIRLGKEIISNNTQFIDGEMAVDTEIQNVWKKILSEIGVTEDTLDQLGKPDNNNIDNFENILLRLTSGMKKTLDPVLIKSNLKFLNDHSKIEREVFKKREYFIVKNQIFTYKITLKTGVPKIMYINRNFSDR